MKSLVTGFMLALASPAVWAQEPSVFESVVECDMPAGRFNLFRSEGVDERLIERRREVHGEMVLQALNRHERFGSTLGFVARSSDRTSYAEFQLAQCGREAASPVCGSAVAWENRQLAGPGHVGGRYTLGEVVPFSLQMTAERQLTIKHAGNIAVLDLPYDVVTLQVKCVGATGKVSFDLTDEPIG